MIDTGQFDRFRVISPRPLYNRLFDVDIEENAAGVSIRYHALHPEKSRNT
jgi:hypothetical protein